MTQELIVISEEVVNYLRAFKGGDKTFFKGRITEMNIKKIMQLVPNEEIMSTAIQMSEIRFKIHQDSMKKCGDTILGVSIGTRIPNTAEAWKRVYKEHKQEIAKVRV